jgi:hypothetical protein
MLIAACTVEVTAPAGQISENELTLDLRAGDYRIVDGPDGQRIEMENSGCFARPGAPLLPSRRLLVLLPPGARSPRLYLEALDSSQVPGTFHIAPAPLPVLSTGPQTDQGHPSAAGAEWYRTRQECYSTDAPWPAEPAVITGRGTLRKYAYVAIAFRPFTWRPLSGRLYDNRAARVRISYRLPLPGSAEARETSLLLADRAADRQAERIFANFEEMKALYQPDPATGTGREIHDFVIITTPGLQPVVAASDFVAWKTSLGHSVLVLSTSEPLIADEIGRDLAERIRTCLRKVWPQWGIEYLLLVGSVADLPMRYCFPNPDDHYSNPDPLYCTLTYVPTDHYYADLSLPDDDSWDSDLDGCYGEYQQDTPDFMAEISVGRIPVSDAGRVVYTLDKMVRYEADNGAWKDHALLGGAIMNYANQDHGGAPFCDGAACVAMIEDNLLGGWEVSRHSEQEGLVPSSYPWPPIGEPDFGSDWRGGQYGLVSWMSHGHANGAYRAVWRWDDGDGVAETSGSDGYDMVTYISTATDLQDDYPSLVCAIGCMLGVPETNSLGRFAVDLLTDSDDGPAAGIVAASRSSAYTTNWPATPGGDASLCYEFNRFLVDGPQGPEPAGDALYHAKAFVHQNYGFDHWYEYLNMHGLQFYGDPSMARTGATGSPATLDAALTCQPAAGTLPFSTWMTVWMTNLYQGQSRRFSGRIDVTRADGVHYNNWRAGWTNVAAGAAFSTSWQQNIPALGTLVGDNIFALQVQDTTPAPYNLPPYSPAGDTDSDSVTVEGNMP